MGNYIIYFIIGAVGYPILEILWRGYSHWSMSILGGICFGLIKFINDFFPFMHRPVKALICAIMITCLEFIAGILLNKILKLAVWDYSYNHLNLYGQICLSYSVLWYALSYALLFLLDVLVV